MIVRPVQVTIKASAQQLESALEAAQTIRKVHPDASINIKVDFDRKAIPLESHQ